MDDKQQQQMISELEGSDRVLSGFWALSLLVVAVFMSAFHLYVAGFGLPGIGSKTFLIFHLTLALVLIFMAFPIKRKLGQKKIPIYDIALSAFSLYVGLFIIQRQDASSIMSGDPTGYEVFIGLTLILLVLEATRRVVGYPLVIIALIFVAYFFLGEYMPGQFYHSRGDFERFIYEITYRNNGIFGTPIYASAQFVFIFIYSVPY
ncbi:hypothetical protein [Piscibacillus salipiscarius]|uniref:hypothetical protein n=1 Tax=Piscibacillus salipiscarius TaxID=299480 RepID=UPI000A55B3ED|nr:hypothetical protein [Piscibacillus salipiscarius]